MPPDDQHGPGRDPSDPIQQRDGESPLWLARLRSFLELPSPSRSVTAAYNAERRAAGKPPVARAPGPWFQASAKFDWQARAAEWDRHASQAAQMGIHDAIREDAKARTLAELRSDRRKEIEEREYTTHLKLMGLIDQMIQIGVVKKIGSADGKTVIVNPAKWNVRSMGQLAKVAFDLGRRSCRAPLSIEADPAADISQDIFFQTSGQLADALPEGKVPDMPADVYVKPPIGIVKPVAGVNGSPSQPPIERPPRPRGM